VAAGLPQEGMANGGHVQSFFNIFSCPSYYPRPDDAASRMPFFYRRRRRRRNRIHRVVTRAGRFAFFAFDSFDANDLLARAPAEESRIYKCRRLKQINRRRHPARFRVRSRALIRYIKNIAKLNFAAIGPKFIKTICAAPYSRHVFPANSHV